MKNFLISHIKDIDGVSPVILLNICKVDFSYQLFDVEEVDDFMTSFLKQDLSSYENIYITDLHLKEETYQRIEKSVYKHKFLVFDHHQTHLFAKKYPYVTIDTKECGTSLFYNFLKEKYSLDRKIIEEYVDHVLDLDNWYWVKKNNILAKNLGDLFEIYGIEKYIDRLTDKLAKESQFSLSTFEVELLEIEQDRIRRYAEKKEEDILFFTYKQYKMGVVYAENYRSELGHILASNHEELDFIVIMNPSGGVSLRTIREEIDLSKIAGELGGGGHKKAAGLPFNETLRVENVKSIFKGAEDYQNK